MNTGSGRLWCGGPSSPWQGTSDHPRRQAEEYQNLTVYQNHVTQSQSTALRAYSSHTQNETQRTYGAGVLCNRHNGAHREHTTTKVTLSTTKPLAGSSTCIHGCHFAGRRYFSSAPHTAAGEPVCGTVWCLPCTSAYPRGLSVASRPRQLEFARSVWMCLNHELVSARWWRSHEPVATAKVDENLRLSDRAQLIPLFVADLPGRAGVELAVTTSEARVSTASEDARNAAV